MSELPKQRHPNCSNDQCLVCLSDMMLLADYLFERTGFLRKFHDILAEYRSWLERNNIPAESLYGWPTPNVYRAENVDGFIADAAEEPDPTPILRPGGRGE